MEGARWEPTKAHGVQNCVSGPGCKRDQYAGAHFTGQKQVSMGNSWLSMLQVSKGRVATMIQSCYGQYASVGATAR